MGFVLRFILSSLLYVFISPGWADTTPSVWFTQAGNKEIKLQVNLFLSSACRHCNKADAFFHNLEATTPWLEVHRHMINTDKAELNTFNQFLQQQKSNDFSVPAIFFCNSHWIGFADAENSGKELLRGLTYCHDEILKTGQLSPTTTKVLRQWANANWYGNAITSTPSAAAFIPLMAITDALNPCSTFCMLTLFAFLWLSEKRSVQLTLGFVFLVAVGVMHYIQQVHTAFFFESLHALRIPAIVIGLGLLAYTSGYARALSEKRRYIPLLLVALSALGVQAYMQICTPNFALIFEQWLQTQQFSASSIVIIEVIYQLVYLLPLLLLTLVVVFWGKSARFKKYQTILAKIARAFLGIVAILFIFYPYGFSKFGISFLALIGAIIIALLIRKRRYH